MSTHKKIDRICVVILVMTIVFTIFFCNGKHFGIGSKGHTIGYENRLFDQTKVHTIDIVMNDWDDFIEKCDDELYRTCNVVIDGETIKNVAIRAKGYTSLTGVKSRGSGRYSFKIEFDHYDDFKSYHGLDKLCLNNIFQDKTYMKDYIAYTLMNNFDVPAPLCSYANIKVNGEEWGLYLAIEAVEDSFLKRNFGSDHGELYKPDSGEEDDVVDEMSKQMDEMVAEILGIDISESNNAEPEVDSKTSTDMISIPSINDVDMERIEELTKGIDSLGGLGSEDVKLKYIDDDINSYKFIFDNAKTNVNKSDKKRLIRSIKSLNEQENLKETVYIDEVIRYFVVHSFLVNHDSYTGRMIHNYYLYEKDGQLMMIPWDYNLAYATMQSGDVKSYINSPIDYPVIGDIKDLPMISWIFDNEEYTEKYHKFYKEFIDNVDLDRMISETSELIDKYVEEDATKFCTVKEFEKGVSSMNMFCQLRKESVKGQLEGTIPSTLEGQNADDSSFVEIGDFDPTDMDGNTGPEGDLPEGFDPSLIIVPEGMELPDDMSITDLMSMQGAIPEGLDIPEGLIMPEGAELPEGLSIPEGAMIPNGFAVPEGVSMPEGGEIPEGFDIPEGFSIPESTEIPEGFKIPDGIGTPEAAELPDSIANLPDEKKPEAEDLASTGSNDEDDKEKKALLLGASTIVMLLGIGFAIKFKR